MKQTDKKKNSTPNNQTKRSVKSRNRDNKLQQQKANQPSKPKNVDTNASSITSDTNIDDTQIYEEMSQNIKILESNG
ncbi:hypothetical protein CTI12_AA304410 [Artemisia annua]|uniref:Uncharacterized protein n=1 Tax=Artemisia annua TaxID=35608 RepID=A0A2U1LKP1_ARTAN|nr:hypothetical protein CTI12_AA304410 [Artemisia annua]